MPALKTTEEAFGHITQRRRNAASFLYRHTGYFSDIEMARRNPELFRFHLGELFPEMQRRLREEEEKKEAGEAERRLRVGLPVSETSKLYRAPEPPLPRRMSNRDARDGLIRVWEMLAQISRPAFEGTDTVSSTMQNTARDGDVDGNNEWYIQDDIEQWRPLSFAHRGDPGEATRDRSSSHIERQSRINQDGPRGDDSTRGATDSTDDESEEDMVIEYISQEGRRQKLLWEMQGRFSDGLDYNHFDYNSVDYNHLFDHEECFA